MAELLHYRTKVVDPSADWMVFIHGAGGSMETWKRQVETFEARFNLLLLDLRDHGASKFEERPKKQDYSLDLIASDVLVLLNHLSIPKSHFMGVSLGSVIIRCIEQMDPKRIKSVVLAGGIFEVNAKLNVLVKSGQALAKIIPFHRLYDLFAWIVLPRANHAASRRIFIREARKISEREFLNWLYITHNIKRKIAQLVSRHLDVPYLVVMGAQDHVFLGPARAYCERYHSTAIEVIDRCGHVVNIERANEFNRRALAFLEQQFPKK